MNKIVANHFSQLVKKEQKVLKGKDGEERIYPEEISSIEFCILWLLTVKKKLIAFFLNDKMKILPDKTSPHCEFSGLSHMIEIW